MLISWSNASFSQQTSKDSSFIINQTQPDTGKVKVKSTSSIKSKVKYLATDSMRFEIADQKVYLYGNAEVYYEDITLKAAYIELSMLTNIVYAKGTIDSTGKEVGNPVFSENESSFNAKAMTYNFETKKGRITEVITKEGDGYIHGEVVKKDTNDNFYIKRGKYTTCDLKHPHYYIGASKLKVIPDDKIVTGPAYLIVEDIPTPLALPFGFFPNKKGQASGILPPTYGESPNLGFFLQDGGYYFGISDKVDVALRADIYSKGSYGLKAASNYRKRYKYSGGLDLKYAKIKAGFPDTLDQNNFFIRWNHDQDSKARPGTRFSADVNAGTSNYNRFVASNSMNYLQNTFSSSISYAKTWTNSNFSIAARHNQNTLTKDINLWLPDVSYNINRIYPFRSPLKVGELKWYDNIGLTYQNQLQNIIQTKDTILFKPGFEDRMKNGMRHTIPVSTSMRFLKYFNFSPSLNYSEFWYLQTINKNFINDTLLTDTITGFRATRDVNFNAQVLTKLYGMYQFRNMGLKAIRHVMTPSVGFSYNPGNNKGESKIFSSKGDSLTYSIYELGILGRPNTVETGNINFAVANNLEMKVKSSKDSIATDKKINIFEALNFSSSYNIFADSLQWSPIGVTGRTFLSQFFDVNFNGTFDPYVFDRDLGRRIQRFEWDKNGRLARLTNANASLNLRLNQSKKEKKKVSSSATPEEIEMINNNLNEYVDFSVPWSASISYNISYNRSNQPIELKGVNEITQSLSFNGDVNLTDKWKVGVISGYDFILKDLTYTSLNIYRDLHCWEMRFNWVPFGFQKRYSIDINVKASVLQDLKLSRKRDWYDLK